MDKIELRQDQQAILHCAHMFYRLYQGVYDSVSPEQAKALAA